MGRRPTANLATPGAFQDRWIVGREELAEVLGLSSSAVSKLTHKGLPKVSVGKYSIPHCVQWYVDLWRPVTSDGPTTTNDEGETLDLRSRLTLAQARKYELDAEVMRGHYVQVETVEHAMSEAAASLAASLDGLGARLAGVLADEAEPAAIQAIITSAAREVRDQYATNLAEWASDVAAADLPDVANAGGDSAPTERQDGRSMG